jgi:hypothetical protein
MTPKLLVMQTAQFHIVPGNQTGLGRYPRSIEHISSIFLGFLSCHAAGVANDIVITVDGGKWYALKLQRFMEEELRQRTANGTLTSSSTAPPPIPPMTGWKDFPAFTIPKNFQYGDIRQYIMNGPPLISMTQPTQQCQESSDEDASDFSTTKPLRRGRQYFLSGHVREVKQFGDSRTHFVKALIMSSFKPDVSYHVHVSIDCITGSIVDGSCECKSSAMGRCSHICALLLAVDDYVIEFGYEPVAGTSKLCSWNRGRKTKKHPGIAHEKKYPKKKAKSAPANAPQQVITHDPRPLDSQASDRTQLFINNFTATLPNTHNNSMWSTILEITYKDYTLTPDEQMLLREKCEQFYHNVCNMVSGSEPVELEDTVGQSKNENWFRQRWFRITASTCKQAVACKSDKALSNFFNTSVWCTANVHTLAMEYGRKHENDAFLQYSKQKKTENVSVSVVKSGMWVNPLFPEFGCSPDGIVDFPGDSSGLLEIKCPKILQNCDPLLINSNLTQQQLTNFCCKCQNNKLVLKMNHSYYYQIQMQMAVCNKTWCDFVVWSPKGRLSVQRVPFDAPFWEEKRKLLQHFYRNIMLPEICEMRVPRRLPPFNVSS